MTHIQVDITEADLRRLITKHFEDILPSVDMETVLIKIETKSKQNFKSEWETAAFRAQLLVDVL